MTSGNKEKKEYVTVPLMTVGDAARYLGIARKTLYHLIESGEIKATQSKNTILIEKKSLDAFRARGALT